MHLRASIKIPSIERNTTRFIAPKAQQSALRSAANTGLSSVGLPSQPGQQFSGTVRYVGDGDGLCVGNSSYPNTWIEVRLADFDAPELHSPDGRLSKSLLEQVAFGQNVTCEARRGRRGRVIVFDRVIAVCRVHGRSIGDLLRARHAPEGGN